MQKFDRLKATAAPMKIANIDTDMIIPKQFLKTIKRSGLGKHLFDEMRYTDGVTEIPDFVLNREPYRKAQILVAGDNFGCGSSREHAPWALEDFGFHVIIAPSFADIFYNNCFKNGLLPIVLDEEIVDRLFHETEAEEGYQLAIDLEAKTVTTPSGESFSFEVDDFRRHCLLNGLDDIGVTLEDAEVIEAYEASRRETAPWLFDAGR